MSPQELQVDMSDITQQQMGVDRSRSTVNNADNNPNNEMTALISMYKTYTYPSSFY